MFWKATRYLLSGLFRTIDLGTDIAYLKLSNFYSIYLYYASIACFFAPAFALTVSHFCICCFTARKSNDFCSQLLIYIFQFLLYPTGLSGFFYFSIFICYKSPSPDSSDLEAKDKHNEKLATVNYIDKTCKIVNLIFKSIPQIAIQVYNNEINNAWTIIAFASIASSIISNMATFFSFFCMIDEEIKASNVNQTSAKVNPIPEENNDDFECYPYGFISEDDKRKKITFVKTTDRNQ